MLFALVCKDKPDHLQVRLDNRPAHVDFLNALNANGGLAFAGPFLGADGKPDGNTGKTLQEAFGMDKNALQSAGILRQVIVVKDPSTGQLMVKENEVLGPMAYLETTTSLKLNAENTSRCFEIPLDESAEQTRNPPSVFPFPFSSFRARRGRSSFAIGPPTGPVNSLCNR